MSDLRPHGISRIGVLVTVACAVALIVIVIVALGRAGDRIDRQLANEAQLRTIAESLVLYAGDEDGRYPRPGLHWRGPDPDTGQMIPGVGPEDVTQNTTSKLYTLLITQNYLTPAIVLSPLERNPKIPVSAGWRPGEDFADVVLPADLVTGSVASYAHMPIAGERAKYGWRANAGANVLQIGNRGPASGIANASSWSCRANGDWLGGLVFGDLHIDVLDIPAGAPITSPSLVPGDNPFVAGGAVIAFTKSMSEAGPVLQHD